MSTLDFHVNHDYEFFWAHFEQSNLVPSIDRLWICDTRVGIKSWLVIYSHLRTISPSLPWNPDGYAHETTDQPSPGALVSRTKLRIDGDVPKVQQHDAGGGESSWVAPKVESERSEWKKPQVWFKGDFEWNCTFWKIWTLNMGIVMDILQDLML